jgi:hypothetical protein
MSVVTNIRQDFVRTLGKPEIIRSSATQNVSTATTLLSFANGDLGTKYSTLLFVLINNDVSENANLLIETSEDGTAADAQEKYALVAPAGQQTSVEIGPNIVRRYWRLSAYSDADSYPTVSISWIVRGIPR